jgi:hypothetical protein
VLLLVHGLARRVPRVVLVRMIANALLDALIGAVPIAGNIGDVFFRANLKNLELLERHARPGTLPTRGDYAFVFVLAGIFGLLVLVPVLLALWMALWVWYWLAAR